MMTKRYYEDYTRKRIVIFRAEGAPWSGLSVHIDRVRSHLAHYHNDITIFNLLDRDNYLFCFWYRAVLLLQFFWYRPQIILLYAAVPDLDIDELMVAHYWKCLLPSTMLMVIEHTKAPFTLLTDEQKITLQHCKKNINKWINIGSKNSVGETLVPHVYVRDSEYILPHLSAAAAIMRDYPLSLRIFLKTKYPLVLISSVIFSNQHAVDEYQAEHIVKMLSYLKGYYPHVGLVWAVGHVEKLNVFSVIHERFVRAGLEFDLYFFSNEQPVWPLMRQVDLLFCVPPGTSPHGTTIAEAIWSKLPIVISDAYASVNPHFITYQAGCNDDCLRVMLSLLSSKGRKQDPKVPLRERRVRTVGRSS